MIFHVKLPDHHLDADSRDVVKLVMGLIATMSALVLSLLIASANSSYDQQSSELKALSANIVLLDQTLGSYGPDAKAPRDGVMLSGKRMTGSGHQRACGPRLSTQWTHELRESQYREVAKPLA
jgi:hypothetical protein